MSDDMLHVMEWHNGEKEYSPFSDAEMQRRQDSIRPWMADNDVDAVLFTSHHCINYYSGWLYCYFGRKYGLVIDHENATTISAGIDGGQPWRRTFGRNITYTDWRRDNFFRAIRQLTDGVKRLGIEFDHIHLDYRRQLEEELPGVEFVDAGAQSMWTRTVKSDEEIALI
ncbi:MAG: creatininase, partial [Rhodospirillaceae bacterium]|nr:creatininase [Rhodospirillaceae bacterium]